MRLCEQVVHEAGDVAAFTEDRVEVAVRAKRLAEGDVNVQGRPPALLPGGRAISTRP